MLGGTVADKDSSCARARKVRVGGNTHPRRCGAPFELEALRRFLPTKSRAFSSEGSSTLTLYKQTGVAMTMCFSNSKTIWPMLERSGCDSLLQLHNAEHARAAPSH